jgi:hypothetical protein
LKHFWILILIAVQRPYSRPEGFIQGRALRKNAGQRAG